MNTILNLEVIKSFRKYSSTVSSVSKVIAQSKAIGVVLGDGWATTIDWDGESPLVAAALIFVHSNPDLPLPIADDRLPRFAYLGWKPGSTIDNPVVAETASIVLPGQFVTVDEGIKVGVKE